MKNLPFKIICYYLTGLFNSYNYANREFAEMYAEQNLINDGKNQDVII